MRNFKRTLALVLALIMIVGTFATVSAASVWYDHAVETLDNLGISNIGNTADEPITRNEFVLWIAKIETTQMSDNAWKEKVNSVDYSDVTTDHYNAAIAYADKLGYVQGHGDGTFGPEDTLLFGELCAIVTRLMRYEDKLVGRDEGHWAYPYYTVAARYCTAFDQTFNKNTDTANMDYQLNKGEAAYVLYTICNMANLDDNANNDIAAKDLILTGDGTNLGTLLEGLGNTMTRNELYYITELEQVVNSTGAAGNSGTGSYLQFSGHPNGGYSSSYANYYYTAPFLTNKLTADGYVTLVNFDKDSVIKISNDEFLKALRVSLGLDAVRDYLNEEKEINIFDYVNVGSMIALNSTVEFVTIKDYNADADNAKITAVKGINLVTDKTDDAYNADEIEVAVIDDYKDLSTFNVSEDGLVVDTYLKMLAGAEQYVGVSVLEVYDSKVHAASDKKILGGLSASATAENAVSWSNVKDREYTYDNKNTTATTDDVEGVYVSSAILTFQGVEYAYNYAEYKVVDYSTGVAQEIIKNTNISKSDIEIYDANWNLMPVGDAINKLINVAQGECFAVFYDVDSDGEYDKIWVKESYPFHIAESLDVAPTDGDTTLVYSPATNNGGYVIGTGNVNDPSYVEYGDRGAALTFNMKMNPVGSVLLDTTVNSQSGTANTDAFSVKAIDSSNKKYNVLEVVLLGSNPYTSNEIIFSKVENRMPNYYTSVDVATLQNGIIEEVTVKQVKGEEYFVAKIRVGETTTTVKIPATAPSHVTLPVTIAGVTADWQFAAKEWFTFLDAAIEATNAGIAGSDTVNSANTAAWMAGRYVRFATDADNNVVFISAMTETSAVGFVADVTKTTTGDNTYKVTVVSYALNEISNDGSEYLKAEAFNYSDINLSGTSSSSLVNGKIKNFASPAVEFTDAAGTTWAKTQYGGGTVFAYVNKATLNADGTIDVDNADGKTSEFFFFNGQKPSVDETGDYFVDNKGNKFPMVYVVNKGYTIDKVVTKEVRASASGSFDYAYKVLYNAIFKQGTLIDEIIDTDGSVITTAITRNNAKIDTVEDLIYVDLRYDDSNAYILSVHFDCTCATATVDDPCTAVFHNSYSSKNYYSQSASVYYNKFGHAFGSSSLRWEYTETIIVDAVPANLDPVEGVHVLSRTEDETARVYFKDIKDGVTITADTTGEQIAALIASGDIVTVADKKDAMGYIGTYSVTYGVRPYYTLTRSGTEYSHDIYFEEVYTDTNAKGIAYFEIDASETLMVQIFIGTGTDSKPVVVTTDAEKAEYPLTDYYIDSNGKVFKPLDSAKITYKVDKDGEFVVGDLKYYYNTTSNPTATDVSFENTNNELGLGYVDEKDTSKGYKELTPYANFTVEDLPEDSEGWFPGKYNVNINGTKYIGIEATNVVVISPSEDGFDITVTNLKALKDTDGLFITAWDANTKDQKTVMNTIVVLGEMPSEADVPAKEEDPTEGYRLVMLHGDATANVVSTEFDNLWYVVSDKDAYSLPSGEAVGAIKRVYTTYTDAKNASVNLALQGGEWYYIDDDNVVATSSDLAKPDSKSATIISATSAGAIIVDKFDGKEKVDISSMPVVFYYLKDGAVTIASTSTSVNVLDATSYGKLTADLEKEYNNAKAEYEEKEEMFEREELSAARLDYYKGLMNDAEAALEAAKEANFAKYRDGQFWGYANNAIFKYFEKQQGVFMDNEPEVSFNYLIIDGTICVDANSFN